jgi:hypothetical protein
LFERGSEHFIREQSIKGKYEALERANSAVIAGTDLLIRKDVTLAASADDPAEIEMHTTRALERVEGLRARKQYTGKEASAKNLEIMSQIEEGQARRMLRNPELRPAVIDDLQNGRFYHMTATHQGEIARAEMQKDEAAETKRNADAEKRAKEAKQADLTAWTQDAMNGRDTPANLITRLDALVQKHNMLDTEYERLHKILTQPDKAEMPSDPATLRRVVADTRSVRPRMSESELIALNTADLLNTKDLATALEHRRSTLESLRREGKEDAIRAYAQAEDETRKWLGMVSPFSQLEKKAEQMAPEVWSELRRRAWPGTGKENATRVAEELVPRIRSVLGTDAQLAADDLRKLTTYTSAAALEEARRLRPKEVPDGFYQTERERLIRAEEMDRLAEQMLPTGKAAKPGAKPATPTPTYTAPPRK